MASSTVEARLEKINSLKGFIKSVEDRVKVITDELNWSYEKLTEECEPTTVACSVNPEHRVGISRIKEHETKCQWLKDGYHAEDVAFPECAGDGSCVVFTPELQETVIRNACSEGSSLIGETSNRGVPQTSARLDQDFTRNEKLALYDYVIANTKGQKLFVDFSTFVSKEDKIEKRVMTPLEIAAAERDAKRRRASYRNKVHTNRKTQTEILREVIESQMEAMKEECSFQNESHNDTELQRRDRQEHSMSESDCYGKCGYSKREHTEDHGFSRSHAKSHDHRDRSKHHSKHRHEKELREERHKKSKKHKRSHSRSRSREKSKHKKSFSHGDCSSSYKSSNRY